MMNESAVRRAKMREQLVAMRGELAWMGDAFGHYLLGVVIRHLDEGPEMLDAGRDAPDGIWLGSRDGKSPKPN